MISITLLALALLPSVLSAPTTALKTVERVKGSVKPNSYLVTLKSSASKASVLSDLGIDATHEWDTVFNGFAGTFNDEQLNSLRAHEDVELIAEDGIVSIYATETNAPWGLARISQDAKLTDQNTADLNFTYTYDDSAGSGVDIYVIDTGINTNHTDFGGRAKWGATFGGYPDQDGNGHGTHVSGTAAGTRYGVAKKANLIAVKVLSDGGSGTNADVVSGFNWAVGQAQASGRPSVFSVSLGGGASTTLDNAVKAATDAGVHVVVAAGNSAADASGFSPARAPTAITVGATTIADAIASYSNFGSLVDIFAPGSNVISDYLGSNTSTASLSGTSMATPHVSGLAAYLIALKGNQSPADLVATIQSLSVRNVISGLPSGTINALANNS